MFGRGKKRLEGYLPTNSNLSDEDRAFLEDVADDIRKALDDYEVFNYDAVTLQDCVVGVERYPEPAVVLEYPSRIVRLRFEVEPVEL